MTRQQTGHKMTSHQTAPVNILGLQLRDVKSYLDQMNYILQLASILQACCKILLKELLPTSSRLLRSDEQPSPKVEKGLTSVCRARRSARLRASGENVTRATINAG